ncbi:YchJ family metal-binding protein [Tamlana sp. 2_MG-2023]|uniref:YchJ family protein n=1 Tax=unclassified Tamlana TaxID=2614803 RepID=UPI0026E38908|nr:MULTISPECIES: YchJ family metal-binding protein [unclassified Tamlana]MDO6759815.1 YchJ family metal-binding protein [Tamlana sp. 2_MG-2023]MDO6791438.1 YchJ family metal-binding protein [Tamlana sp. 1_MG-2023]
MSCYCGQINTYENCCERIHKNIAIAKTAEKLMRSRYSAFVLAKGDYLMESHHSKTRKPKEKKAIVDWAKSVQWIKLEVLETTKGLEEDSEGTVTFNAYFFENGNVEVIHEKSAFVKENNLWKYLGLSK